MDKKYEMTTTVIHVSGRNLYRIKALKSFEDVKIGDFGGFIENEDNLSQDGNAWVYDDAKVFDNAKVYNNAKVFDNAKVFGNAQDRKSVV